MSSWNFGQSIFVSSLTPDGVVEHDPADAAGAAPPEPPRRMVMTGEWRRWIAENVLLQRDANTIVEAMVRDGFDRQTAADEVTAALESPYIEAARGLGSAGPGGENLANRVKKRDWVLETYRKSARMASDYGQVARARRPGRQEFLDRYYATNTPVVIEGAMDDWPAMTEWTADNLKRRFGDRMVEVQANRNADANYEINSTKLKKEMPFGQFVDLTETAGETNNYYITANNSGKNKAALRELWDDIRLFPEYLRDNDPNNRGFFWFGPAGTITPLHHDLTNNFMAQVRGRKLVKLIAPYELPDLYNHRHCFSQVDVGNPDLAKFPRFADVRVIDVTIGPGDLLFLPIGWWHYVRGLDISITMTFTNFVFDNDFSAFYSTYNDV